MLGAEIGSRPGDAGVSVEGTWVGVRRVQRSARPALLLTALAFLASPAAADIRGRVFEDVNYGGGAGRSFGASLGVGRDAPGSSSTTTPVHSWSSNSPTSTATTPSLPAAGTYTVRVVNSTVTSSRTGYVAGLLPVQTFRTDASSGSGAPDAVTDRVGGEVPSLVDAGAQYDGVDVGPADDRDDDRPVDHHRYVRRPGPRRQRQLRLQLRHDRQRERQRPGFAAAVPPQQQRPGREHAAARASSWTERAAARETSIFMISDGAAHRAARRHRQPAHRGGSRRDHARDRLCPPSRPRTRRSTARPRPRTSATPTRSCWGRGSRSAWTGSR